MAIDETIITHCEECGEFIGEEDIAEVYRKGDVWNNPDSPAPVGMIIHASCYDEGKHNLA